MTIEQQFETVLHDALHKARFNYSLIGNRTAHEAVKACAQQLAALLAPTTPLVSCSQCAGGPTSYCRACFEGRVTAPPDREGLHRLLQNPQSHYVHETAALSGCGICSRMVDRIMAWATASRPPLMRETMVRPKETR